MLDLDLSTLEDHGLASLVREVVELDQEDLDALASRGPEHCLPELQTIRAIHHTIALKLAVGDKPVEICRQLSVTPQTISKLERDPQFQELVEGYRDQVVEATLDTASLLGTVTQESLVLLLERLNGEERDQIPTSVLLKIISEGADRTGHSPIRRSESVTHVRHGLEDGTINRIKELHGEDNRYSPDTTVDAKVVSSAPAEIPAELSHPDGSVGSITVVAPALSETQTVRARPEGPRLPEQGDEVN